MDTKKIILLFAVLNSSVPKYMEGRLKTSETWAFLARFCFLSGEGQFEYYIEFNEDQGHPNLLLYYDTPDQWPSVYKTTKNCFEKESVLNIQQNQIVNLTLQKAEFSGCSLLTKATPTAAVSTSTTTKLAPEFDSLSDISNDTGLNFTEYPAVFDNFTDLFISLNDSFDVFNESDRSEPKIVVKRAVPTKPTKYDRPKNRVIVCRNARRFRSSRERWWFVAISNCKGRKGIDIKYRILMTNGPPGDYWHEQFSADEFYILPVLMAFSIAYTMLILAIVICSVELKSRQLLHTTYKLFSFSVVVQYFGILLQSVSYLHYALNGIGSSNTKMLGLMVMGTSEICFLLLLLLLAKGYTITRGRLSLPTSIKITIFMCLYSVMYVSLFIYEAKIFDPGEVLYLYESPAGYGLIILKVFAWCIFIYSTVFTLKKYPEKCNFYYPFNICGTLWFIAGPAFILSANNYIDKWIRESVVCAVLLFITLGGHLMFLLLTMPSLANKNFPYHVRTTQIGVMELAGTSFSGGSVEHFNHHVYEPSRPAEQTVIIPLTRRTEEIFGGVYGQHLYAANFRRRATDGFEDTIPHGDSPMRNVLSWSLAKSLSAAGLNEGNGIVRRSSAIVRDDGLQRANSVRSESAADSERSITEGLSRGEEDAQLDDYGREVPVELFSISKSVASNDTKQQ